MRRATVAGVTVALVLLACRVALADNYSYQRTRSADASAGSMVLRISDFPARLRMTGGRVKPDETASGDSCNGYRPKESDLVLTGDAESRFHDSPQTMAVDSEVGLFRTTAMAAMDVKRGKRMLAPACQLQIAKQEHVNLTAYRVLGHPKCSCQFAVSVMLQTTTANPKLDLLTIVTAVRKGRLEATVSTTVGEDTGSAKSGLAALNAAYGLQGLALKATLSRLQAS